MQPLEKDFIQRFHEDDETAFKKLFEKYYSNLILFALKFVADTCDREDIVMNAFAALWRKLPDIEHEANIPAYLIKCVQNGCIQHLQRQKRASNALKKLALVEEFQQATAKHQKWVSDIVEGIKSLIEKLPEHEKKVFLLSFVDGLTSEEIAEKLNVSITTVYNNRSKALTKLRALVFNSNLKLDIKYMVLFILLFTDAFSPK
jgi:RNA polymerase sigma-70 factor (ECF subfamily)